MEPDKNQLPNDPTDRKIIELCREGKKIEAVKICKVEKQWGLKESKDYVDLLCTQHGIEKSGGCGSTAAVFILIVTGLFFFIYQAHIK